MASIDFNLDSAAANCELISGASSTIKSCPFFTLEPISTFSVFTKLLTFAYKSTCWKPVNSAGKRSSVVSFSFSKRNVSVLGSISAAAVSSFLNYSCSGKIMLQKTARLVVVF
jgi:hypothetical protein